MPFSHAGPKRRLPDGKQLANDFPVCMVRNSCKQELWFHKHDLNTFELLHALWQKCVVRCQCVSALVAEPCAMDSRPFRRDDQIVVDKDGIPHYTGVRPELMKDYRRRVLFAFNNLEGSGDDEAKERKSLEKKQHAGSQNASWTTSTMRPGGCAKTY